MVEMVEGLWLGTYENALTAGRHMHILTLAPPTVFDETLYRTEARLTTAETIVLSSTVWPE